MGLSLHYSGTLKDLALLPQLTAEVQDLCTSLGWRYRLFDDKDFKGICFSPPECEPLFLTFHNSPELASPVLWKFDIHPFTTISVKTQFAGMDVHLAVVRLLKYLSARYFKTFDVSDEGGYWESGDEAVLRRQFARYQFLLNAVEGAIRNMEKAEGETTESLVQRLERMLSEKWKEWGEGEDK